MQVAVGGLCSVRVCGECDDGYASGFQNLGARSSRDEGVRLAPRGYDATEADVLDGLGAGARSGCSPGTGLQGAVGRRGGESYVIGGELRQGSFLGVVVGVALVGVAAGQFGSVGCPMCCPEGSFSRVRR